MIRLADIREAVAREGRAVLVLVAEAHGSAPREAGAAMLVAPSGTLGTVGGGTVEHRAIGIARAMLAGEAEARAEVEFPLGPALDQCCGGRMRLAFAMLSGQVSRSSATPSLVAAPPAQTGEEAPVPAGHWAGQATGWPERRDALQGPAGEATGQASDLGVGASSEEQVGRDVRGAGEGAIIGRPVVSAEAIELWPGGPIFREPAPGRQVLVYGAGHVGAALVRALAPLPFRVVWVDARAGACAMAPEGVEVHETPLPEAVAAGAEMDALHVVLTHSHALDLEIVATVLARSFGFCGLIGSATKRATFRKRLAERALAREVIERLVCPIGLPGLRDRRPAVIAASVAAQLCLVDAALSVRRPVERAG